MNLIYRLGENGGGAFPSTHVAAAIIAFIYSTKFFKKGIWIIGFFSLGISVATIYCSYHYAIDSVAGIITGVLFYYIGKAVYYGLKKSGTEMMNSV